MVLLLAFAIIAGAGTAITPCVLPVLPAILSASAAGGRRRPLGIVLRLGVTFTIAIVALASLVKGVGLGSTTTRDLAVVVLIVFGVMMLIPELAQRVQAPLSRLARFGPKTRGDGFVSGLGVGAALGFVCAPCAGPILTAVIGVSSSTGPTVRVVLIAVAYSLGLSAVLLLWAFGGRAVIGRVKRAARGYRVERALGAVLLLTGVAMAFNLDTRFENVLAKHTPDWTQDPSASLEASSAVQNKLRALRPESKFVRRQAAARGMDLRDLGTAPNFTDTQDWFNTPADRPLSLTGLRGHVVLVDFWTYTCINCIRTIPFVEKLYQRYHRYGLDVVGVETPEFTFEQDASNVAQAIKDDGITYPVVQDNRYGTWDAYQNQYWPAEYYIDITGELRHYHFGEGGYSRDEQVVRELLRGAGDKTLPKPFTTGYVPTASHGPLTDETYLDPERAADEKGEVNWAAPLRGGTRLTYHGADSLRLNEWALYGDWNIGSQSITPSGGSSVNTISGHVQARDVYLVMTSAGNRPRQVTVTPSGGTPHTVTVTGQHLYQLLGFRKDRNLTFSVRLPRGVRAYDFTFG